MIHSENGPGHHQITHSLRLDWTTPQSLNPFINSCLQTILIASATIYKLFLLINIRGHSSSSSSPSSSHHHHLERQCLTHQRQEPFLLEDSHGRIKPIYMDCITSWTVFDAWLEAQFRDLPGYSRVQKGAYVLHDSVANRDIDRGRRGRGGGGAWESVFLPGQRIVMCMIFDVSESNPSSPSSTSTSTRSHSRCCPKCQNELSPAGVDCDAKW